MERFLKVVTREKKINYGLIMVTEKVSKVLTYSRLLANGIWVSAQS